ncbi:hypothetical protein AgCh_016154 [Apium graveolens]
MFPLLPSIWVTYIGLAFDPSKSPHYKVITFVQTSSPDDEVGEFDTVGDFHIYSSETKTWKVFVQSFVLGPSIVYEMKSDYSEWFLKYQIDLAPISKAFPEMTGYKAFGFKYNYAVDLISVVRRENVEEDSLWALGVPAFDPSNSPYYQVIAFVQTSPPNDYVGEFYIYSSETKTWRVSVQSFALAPYKYLDMGIYWKGCVHWLSTFHIEHERASAVPDGLYFNDDEGQLGTFPRPPISVESTFRRSFYIGESEGHLHFTEVCSCTTTLSEYEMKSDYSEWFLKYHIDLPPISKALNRL